MSNSKRRRIVAASLTLGALALLAGAVLMRSEYTVGPKQAKTRSQPYWRRTGNKKTQEGNR